MATKRGHKWTDEEISTLKRMRGEGASYTAISKEIGTANKDTVRIKILGMIENGEMPATKAKRKSPSPSSPKTTKPKQGKESRKAPAKVSSRKPWSESDIAILTKGYEAGDDMHEIIGRLERKCTPNNAYSKAASLKLKRGSSSKGRGQMPAPISPLDKTHDETHLRTLMLSGISPNEASAFCTMTKMDMKATFDRMGWKKDTGPKERGILRGRLQNRALGILGRPLDRDDPEHLMVILTLCADSTQRNLSEIAKLSLLPLPWIERVFGRLDLEGVWPVTDDSSGDLCASDYERFAEICDQERHSLQRIIETYGRA